MNPDSPRLRIGMVGIIAVSLFAALFARLWYLQVAAAPQFAAFALLACSDTSPVPAWTVASNRTLFALIA